MDIYYTIKETGSARYTEKMSRFLAFALPVKRADEAKSIIKKYQNDYHDARHVCWAYMLGPERQEWQLNDNGEPSGTAENRYWDKSTVLNSRTFWLWW